MRINISMRTLVFCGFLLVPGAAFADAAHDHAAGHVPAPMALNAAALVDGGALQSGKRGNVTVTFTRAADGTPVLLDDLEPVHESRIHLLIVDPALSDYHHEHPVPGAKPGEYNFAITPKTDCSYKVWAQLHFKGGQEETVTATIPGAQDCRDRKPDAATAMQATVDGYGFTMTADTEMLRVGQDTMLTLSLTGPDGKAFAGLEPVMGAFAHLVGFYDDYEHVAHIHPLGAEPQSMDERGGPELKFHYRPDHAGLVKMFAQVRVGDQMLFAPLTMTVAE